MESINRKMKGDEMRFIGGGEIMIQISAGAVIIRKDETNEKIYFCMLKYPKGYWGLSRGWIEEGEKEIDTAKREIKEETGLKEIKIVSGFREKAHFQFKSKGKIVHKTTIFFLATTKQKKIKKSIEHQDIGWFEYEEILKLPMYENTKEIVKRSYFYINNNKNKVWTK